MKTQQKTRIVELRKECEDKGLLASGSIAELKARIKKFDSDAELDLFRASQSKGKILEAKFALADTNFLIQLKLANLLMYFVHGYFYPANMEESEIYREQNRKTDLLTQFPDYIPMSKCVVNDFDETQVLVEVILTREEMQELEGLDDVNFFDSPLPVSRLNAIYFANNSSRLSFLSSIDVFPDAFIPKEVCRIIPEGICTARLSDAQPSTKRQSNWKSVIDKYDRLLGMVAFLKNTSLFYTNQNNEYLEYTPGYFQVLSLINDHEDVTQRENSFFRWIISPESIEIDSKLARFQFSEILKAVYDNREFEVGWALDLLENSIAFEQNKEVIEQLRLIVKLLYDYKKMRIDYRTILTNPLVEKNIPIMILIFLIKFPNRGLGHSDKQAFKNYFRTNESKIERSHAEYIFAVMGLYYGYSALVKEDRIELNDPFFNSLAKENSQIKFKLDSFLDLFTIESIFEFSKGNGERLKMSFEFLKGVKAVNSNSLNFPQNSGEYLDQSQFRFSKKVVNIRRIDPLVAIGKEISLLYGEHITQKDHLYTYIVKHHPELLDIKTEMLIQLMAQRPGNKMLTELRDTLDMDRRYGKTKIRR